MNQVERLLVLRLVLPYVPKPQSLRRVSKCLLSDFRSTTTRVAWLLNNREPAEALSVASTKGWVGAVRIIIAKHATTIGAYSQSVALSYAMLHRKADVMRVLLEKGCPKIMWPQFLPLATAVQKGRPDMAEILLNAGANPNIRVLSHATGSYVPGVLYFAVASRPEYYDPGSPMQRSLLQQLISAGLNVKDRRAAEDVLNVIRTNEGVDLSVLLFLIQEGLDLGFIDHDGTTLLLSLLIGSEMNPNRRVNNFEIIRSVLSIGIRDAGGVALFYAVHKCDLEAVLLLLNYRANEFDDVVAAGLVAQNHYNLSIERALHHSLRNWT